MEEVEDLEVEQDVKFKAEHNMVLDVCIVKMHLLELEIKEDMVLQDPEVRAENLS